MKLVIAVSIVFAALLVFSETQDANKLGELVMKKFVTLLTDKSKKAELDQFLDDKFIHDKCGRKINKTVVMQMRTRGNLKIEVSNGKLEGDILTFDMFNGFRYTAQRRSNGEFVLLSTYVPDCGRNRQ